MTLLLLFARLLLCAVFLVAGLAKLADLPGSRQAMRDFGVPNKLGKKLGRKNWGSDLHFPHLGAGQTLLSTLVRAER